MSIDKDINSLVKVKKIKQKLSQLPDAQGITSVRGGGPVEESEKGIVIVPPIIIHTETYDDTKDVEITDTSSNTHTLKTGKTGWIEDSVGTQIEISDMTFKDPNA
jgi:hypothetical protein